MQDVRNDWRWVERTFSSDFRVLLSQRRLAWRLYLADVAENKRNSGLGLIAPFISVFVHVALLGTVMALVFNEPITTFIPFFAVSFSIWQSISIFVSDVAYSNEKMSRYLSFPNLSGYLVYLVACCEFGVALCLKLVAAALVIAWVSPTLLAHADHVGILLGFLAIAVLVFCWSLPIAYVFDRVRALRGFLPQILFATYLVTPILWEPKRVAEHSWLVDFNPVFHVIEVLRAPVLSGRVPVDSLIAVTCFSIVGLLLSRIFFAANRELVIYRWVA